MRCVDGDYFEVERHRHKDQAGDRDRACSDQKKKLFHWLGLKISAAIMA
jgi:hypothetical protein